MLSVLSLSFIVTLVYANTGSKLDNCPTTTSLQQSIANLTNLVNDTLTKSAQSCLANVKNYTYTIANHIIILQEKQNYHKLCFS